MHNTQTNPTANPLCVPCLHLSQAGLHRDSSFTSLYIPTTTYEGGNWSLREARSSSGGPRSTGPGTGSGNEPMTGISSG